MDILQRPNSAQVHGDKNYDTFYTDWTIEWEMTGKNEGKCFAYIEIMFFLLFFIFVLNFHSNDDAYTQEWGVCLGERWLIHKSVTLIDFAVNGLM